MGKVLIETGYKEILLKEVVSLPNDKLKEVADFVEFLSLREFIGLDKLIGRTRAAAEKKGYKPADIDKLIEEVRKK